MMSKKKINQAMNSNFVHTPGGLSGLSGLPGNVSDARLRAYVMELMQQENGQLANTYKLGGNMAWWKRATDPSRDMYRFFAALDWDPERVLAELKRRLPDIWGLSAPSGGHSAAGSAGGGSAGPGPSAAGQPASKSGMNWWVIGGMIAAGLGGTFWLIGDDDK